MTRFVGSTEAARMLGVQKASLYAYVSRGLISRRVAVDGRTSLYSADDIDALAARVRRRESEPRPSLDVQVVTGVTTLDEDGVRYRGHDVAELARTVTYEQVAELLWTGSLPTAVVWPTPAAADVGRARRVAKAVGGRPGVATMAAAAGALGVHHAGDDPAAAARRLLGVVPAVLGGGDAAMAAEGGLGWRLAGVWRPDDVTTFGPAIDRALVLLADHELATSTLAVRVAGSTWAGPVPAIVAGLATVQGPLHGGAAREAHELLVECEQVGAAGAVARRVQAGERLPGYGHKIYKGDDPRLAPLLEVVAELPDPHGRRDVLTDLLAETGARFTRRPNVDLGLGALSFVGDLPPDMPLFATARIAGFAAHLIEELQERPLRYRGLARTPA
ncbi:MAG: citrate/2-methylcitrate synthase [Ilumatobacteraceae bacterium]